MPRRRRDITSATRRSRSRSCQPRSKNETALPKESAPVYNLEIEEYHTYLIGRPLWGFSVWAHNEGGICAAGANGAAAEGRAGAAGAPGAERATAAEAAAPKVGSLEGSTGVIVRDTATGNAITDIDLIKDGVLWEEKSAIFANDIQKWVSKNITAKFNAYMKARTQLPGYENAPIGFKFGQKPVDPDLENAIISEIEALRGANPGVDIRLEW